MTKSKYPCKVKVAYAGRRDTSDMKLGYLFITIKGDKELFFKNIKGSPFIGHIYEMQQNSEVNFSVPHSHRGWEEIRIDETDDRMQDWEVEDKTAYNFVQSYNVAKKMHDKSIEEIINVLRKIRWKIGANQRVAFDIWLIREISKIPKQT